MIFSFSFFPVMGLVLGFHYFDSNQYPELFDDEIDEPQNCVQIFFLLFGISIVWL